MKNMDKISRKGFHRRSLPKSLLGFSLVELMVAMSVFLVVGGAVVALVRRHVPLFNTAQNQANLNITLRNAVAQFQMEVVNAGSTFSANNPMPFWPIGATIQPATANCTATRIYVQACFDTLSLIDADSSLAPLAPSLNSDGTGQADTSTGNIYLTVPNNPALGTSAQYNAWAAALPAGTELMLVQGGTDMPAGQPSISVVVVQAPGASSNGNFVKVPIAATIGIGCNDPVSGATVPVTGIPNIVNGQQSAVDPMHIYDDGECLRFKGTFDPLYDYAIKLNATTYSVDGSDPTNPRLIRTNPASVTPDVIAEQIVGFTVGAWSTQINQKAPIPGGYSNIPADYHSDWASIRSLKIQLIARAAPNNDQSASFQNSYDQGPYQVQGISVVINPRNLNTN